MAFTFSLTLNWLKHRLLSVARTIENRPANYFIQKHTKHFSSPVQQLSALSSNCPLCGYSMAELILENGWSLTTCSATGLKDMLNNAKLKQWITK